ncbi:MULTISPECIES: hypothetical protein [Streptomyces]|uniref:hypothetical protein n=1 Tax=Streptomyces TaxID=1883 RepID=UPI00345BDEE0
MDFEGSKFGADHAQLIQPDIGEQRSREACGKRRVYTTVVNADTLMVGSQICVRNQEGYAALITIKTCR